MAKIPHDEPSPPSHQAQFAFIELLLAFEGLVTNERLRLRFNVGNVQASRVLAAYREMFAENIELVRGEGRGRYQPSPRFKAAVAELDLGEYLKQIGEDRTDGLFERVGRDMTRIEPRMFRTFNQAVRSGDAVRMTYRSMTHPKGVERVVHPKAFVYAGRRWHVRAYDWMRSEFRDFNLARVQTVQAAQHPEQPPDDEDWRVYVDVRLVAHPDLSSDQQRLIRDELFMGAVARVVRVRRALVRYLCRELEAAEDPTTQRPPDYQIHVSRIEPSSG